MSKAKVVFEYLDYRIAQNGSTYYIESKNGFDAIGVQRWDGLTVLYGSKVDDDETRDVPAPPLLALIRKVAATTGGAP